MLKETAVAAVAKLRTDLPDVTLRDLGAARGAMGVRARGAAIDENEAEHGDLHEEAAFAYKDSARRRLFPDRYLVIGSIRPSSAMVIRQCQQGDAAAPAY